MAHKFLKGLLISAAILQIVFFVLFVLIWYGYNNYEYNHILANWLNDIWTLLYFLYVALLFVISILYLVKEGKTRLSKSAGILLLLFVILSGTWNAFLIFYTRFWGGSVYYGSSFYVIIQILSIVMGLMFCVSWLLIGMYYKHRGMIGLAITMLVLSTVASIIIYVIGKIYEGNPSLPYVELVNGIIDYTLLITYLFIWAKKAVYKPHTVKVEETPEGLKVVLITNSAVDGSKKDDQTGDLITEQIFELIKLNPQITRADISSAMGMSPYTVQKHIDKLKEGRIRRIGGSFGGYWEIIR